MSIKGMTADMARIAHKITIITLWWTYKKLWKITIFNGKTKYKWPFSIAMLVYQRVSIGIFHQLQIVGWTMLNQSSEITRKSSELSLREMNCNPVTLDARWRLDARWHCIMPGLSRHLLSFTWNMFKFSWLIHINFLNNFPMNFTRAALKSF